MAASLRINDNRLKVSIVALSRLKCTFIVLSCQQADGLLTRLHREGMEDAVMIGEVVAEPKGRIWII
jgi:hypothetical protein